MLVNLLNPPEKGVRRVYLIKILVANIKIMEDKIMKLCVILIAVISFTTVKAQTQTEEIKHSTYYYQKKSMFEILPNDEGEIIFLGNSITDGCEWSELFNDLRIKNRGISGDVTGGILDRLTEVVQSKPAKIFIMIGINDLARGRSVQDITTDYNKIVEEILKASEHTELYIQSVLPVNPDFDKFQNHTNKNEEVLKINQNLKDLAKNYNVNYIDLHKLFLSEDNKLDQKYTNDGLHLTAEGYALWKSAIDNYITK